MTRTHVTVALSGDGGDELFSGYNRYVQGLRLARALRCCRGRVGLGLARTISAVPPASWDRVFDAIPCSMRPRLPGDKLHKLAGVLVNDATNYYERSSRNGAEAWSLVKGATRPKQAAFREEIAGPVRRRIVLDAICRRVTYLPDDILTKVDRASMAVGLEARVPMLDHRLVDFAWQLPANLKIRGGQGKWLLRQVSISMCPSTSSSVRKWASGCRSMRGSVVH